MFLDFVEDFCQCFGPYLSRMHMRPMEVSYPYEYFLHTLTESDAHLFDCCRFEDDLWAGSTCKASTTFWAAIPFCFRRAGSTGSCGSWGPGAE